MHALRANGAVVSGFDLSPAMVELALTRLGDDADVRVADLGAPLPYASDEFDLVVASAGFRITTVTEPEPAADTPAELLPTADGRSFICFLFFELR
jgi:SAM-dependent methyltransferase